MNRLAQHSESNLLECNCNSIDEDGCVVIKMLDWDWPSSKLFEWELKRTFDDIRGLAEKTLGARAIPTLQDRQKYPGGRCIENDSAMRLKICEEVQRFSRGVLDQAKV